MDIHIKKKPHQSNSNAAYIKQKKVGHLPTLVPRTRLELARANAHYPLKVACLPISPPGPFYVGEALSAEKVCKYRHYFVIRKIFH